MSNSILATKQSVDEGLAKKLDIDVGAANKGRILIVQPGGRFEVDDIPRATVIRDSTVATHEGLATELAVATKIEQLSYDSKHLIYVDPDYTGLTSRGTRTQPYKTLTLAIDATGAGDQDVIVLNPGVYPPDPVKGETVLNNADNSIIGISTSQQARTKLLGNLLISGDRFGVQDLLVDGKVSIDADNTYFDNLTTTGDLNKDAINSTPNAYSYVRDSVIGGNVTVKRGVLYLENVNLEKGVVQLLGGTLITKNCSGVTINALGGQYIDLGGSYFTTHAAQSDASIKCDSGVALAYIESGISGDLTTGFKPIVMNAQVYYLGSLQFDYDASTIGNGTRLPGGLQSRQIVDGKTRTGYTTTGDYVNQHLDGISDALESIRTLAEQGLKTPKSVAYENTIYADDALSILGRPVDKGDYFVVDYMNDRDMNGTADAGTDFKQGRVWYDGTQWWRIEDRIHEPDGLSVKFDSQGQLTVNVDGVTITKTVDGKLQVNELDAYVKKADLINDYTISDTSMAPTANALKSLHDQLTSDLANLATTADNTYQKKIIDHTPNSVLTTPAGIGGQPGSKAISDFVEVKDLMQSETWGPGDDRSKTHAVSGLYLYNVGTQLGGRIDLKQDKIQTTKVGAGTVLMAPVAHGDQPTGKQVTDFVLKTDLTTSMAESGTDKAPSQQLFKTEINNVYTEVNKKQNMLVAGLPDTVMIPPAQLGGQPGSKALSDFVQVTDLINNYTTSDKDAAPTSKALNDLYIEVKNLDAADRAAADSKFQLKIVANGVSNLLTAPGSSGGQPGTKAISEFVLKAHLIQSFKTGGSTTTAPTSKALVDLYQEMVHQDGDIMTEVDKKQNKIPVTSGPGNEKLLVAGTNRGDDPIGKLVSDFLLKTDLKDSLPVSPAVDTSTDKAPTTKLFHNEINKVYNAINVKQDQLPVTIQDEVIMAPHVANGNVPTKKLSDFVLHTELQALIESHILTILSRDFGLTIVQGVVTHNKEENFTKTVTVPNA